MPRRLPTIPLKRMHEIIGGQAQASGEGAECRAELQAWLAARKAHIPHAEAFAAAPRDPEVARREKAASDEAGAAWRKAHACLHSPR